MSHLAPAGDHRTLWSVGKAKTPLRIYPAPQRDFTSPLLSEELEADTTLASQSRSRSCITPGLRQFLPALHQQGMGAGLFLGIFMELQSHEHQRKQKGHQAAPQRAGDTSEAPLGRPLWGLLSGTAHKETTTLTPLKQHQPENRRRLLSGNSLRHTLGNRWGYPVNRLHIPILGHF